MRRHCSDGFKKLVHRISNIKIFITYDMSVFVALIHKSLFTVCNSHLIAFCFISPDLVMQQQEFHFNRY